MDKWKPIDVNEWVFETVNGKPESIKDNDFVNLLYGEHKLKTETG